MSMCMWSLGIQVTQRPWPAEGAPLLGQHSIDGNDRSLNVLGSLLQQGAKCLEGNEGPS